MILEVEQFMHKNTDWPYLLSNPPYNLTIKYDDQFVILSYSIGSDMSNRICQECRGIIFHLPDLRPVCVPFFKFFNHFEPYAAEIDWSSAVVLEKIDGSIIKVWNYAGQWHISTNNVIDAHKAAIGDSNYTFGSLFESIFPKNYTEKLDPNYTYIFELTSPLTRVVVNYDRAIWFLSRRNNFTLNEDNIAPAIEGMRLPQLYPLSTFDECANAVAAMDDTHEGFVVRDANYNRIKIKTEAWFAASKMNNLSLNGIIELWKQNKLDDVQSEKVDIFLAALEQAASKMEQHYINCSSIERKDLSKIASPYNGYIYARLDGKVRGAKEYLSTLPTKTINKIVFS